VYVLFEPRRAGVASAALTLHGDGNPLQVALRATAFALPSVTRLSATGSSLCFAAGSSNRMLISTDQAAIVRWRLLAQPHAAPARCRGSVAGGADSGRTSVSGRTRSRAQRGHGAANKRFAATVALPLGGRRGVRPGVYRVTASASDTHGAGRSRSVVVTVTR
jgi:hypothetical protein